MVSLNAKPSANAPSGGRDASGNEAVHMPQVVGGAFLSSGLRLVFIYGAVNGSATTAPGLCFRTGGVDLVPAL